MEFNEALDAVKNNPNDAHAWVRLGKELKRVGKDKEAKESFERALYLDPSLEHVYEELLSLEARATLPDWVHRMEVGESPLSGEEKQRFLKGGVVGVAVLLILCLGGALFAFVRAPSPSRSESQGFPLGAGSTLGQTRAEAVPLGEALLLEEGLRVQVLKTFPDASDFKIRYYLDTDGDGEKDEFLEVKPDGERPYIVRLLVENVSAEDPQYLSFYGMSLSTAEGLAYDEDCGVTPEDLTGELPLGEKTEGNICFLVAEEEQGIEFMMYEPLVGSQRRFFRLIP
ncbi:MAG: DUF4352 domain-containing protein [Ardenticatenales bacterium]|nr:DUF4352 domain-containing protein [Ardenticatenales bacterium]